MDARKKQALLKWVNALSDDQVESFICLKDCKHFISLIQASDASLIPDDISTVVKKFGAVRSYLEGFYQVSFKVTRLINFEAVSRGDLPQDELEWEIGKITLALFGTLVQDKSREHFVSAALCLDEEIQLEIKDLLESVVYPCDPSTSLHADFADVLKRKSDTSAHLDAALFFKLVASGLTSTPKVDHHHHSGSSLANVSNDVPCKRLLDVMNSPLSVGNISLSSPLRALTLASSPTTPLGALMHSPQLAQKIMNREREHLSKVEAMLRQKEQDLRKLELALQNEKHLRSELEMDLHERSSQLDEKDTKIIELEHQLQDLRKLRDDVDELEILRSEKDSLKKDLSRLQSKLSELQDMRDHCAVIEKENEELISEIMKAREAQKTLDTLQKTCEEYRTMCHKQQVELSSAEVTIQHRNTENDQLRRSVEELKQMYENAVHQCSDIRREKEELEEICSGSTVHSFGSGESMGIITDKRMSELQAELDQIRANYIDPAKFQKLQDLLENEMEAKATYETKFKDVSKKLMSAEDQLDKLKISLKHHEGSMASLHAAQQALQQRETELVNHVETLQESEKRLKRSQNELQQEKCNMEENIKALKKEVSHQQAELQLMKGELDTQNQVSENRRVTLAQMEALVSEKKSAEQQLAQKCESQVVTINKLKNKLEMDRNNFQKIEDDLKKSLHEAQNFRKEAELKIDNEKWAKETVVKALKEEINLIQSDAQQKKARLDEEIKALIERNAQLESQLQIERDRSSQRYEELTKQFDEHRKVAKESADQSAQEKSVLTLEKSAQEFEIHKLKVEYERMEKSLNSKCQRLEAEFSEKVTVSSNQISKLTGDHKKELIIQEQLKKEINSLHIVVQKYQEDVKTFNSVLEEYKEKASQITGDLNKSKFDQDQLQCKITELLSQLDDEKVKYQKLCEEQQIKKNELLAQIEDQKVQHQKICEEQQIKENELLAQIGDQKVKHQTVCEEQQIQKNELLAQIEDQKVKHQKFCEEQQIQKNELLAQIEDQKVKHQTVCEEQQIKKNELLAQIEDQKVKHQKFCEEHRLEMNELLSEIEDQKADHQKTCEKKDCILKSLLEEQATLQQKLEQIANELKEERVRSEQVCSAKDDLIQKQNIELETLRAQAAEERGRLLQEIEMLKAQLSDQSQQLRNKENEMHQELKATRARYEEEIQERSKQSDAELSKLSAELLSAEEQDGATKVALEKQIQNLLDSLVQKDIEFQSKMEQIEKNQKEKDLTITELREEINTLHLTEANLMSGLDIAEGQFEITVAHMKAEHAKQLKAQAEQNISFKKTLQREIAEMTELWKGKDEELVELRSNLQATNGDKEAMSKELSSLQEGISVKDALIRELQNIKQNLKDKVNEYRHLLDSVKIEKDNINENLQEEKSLKQEVIDKMQKLEKKLTEANCEVEELKKKSQMENEECKDRIVDTESYWRSQLEQLEEDYNRGMNEQKEEYNRELQEQQSKFEGELQCLSDQKDIIIATRLAEFERRISKLQGELTQKQIDMEKALEDTRLEKESCLKEVMVVKNKEIESVQKELETQLASLQNEMSQKIAELESMLEQERQNHEQQVKEAQAEFEEQLKGQVDDYEERLSQMKCQYNKYLESLNEETNTKSSELQEKVLYLEETNLSQEQELKELQAAKNDLVKSQSELEAKIKNLEKEKTMFQDLKTSYEEELEVLQNAQSELSQEKELKLSLDSQLAELQEKFAAVEKDLKKAIEDKLKEKGEKEELERQLTYTQDRTDTLVAELSSQQQQLAAVEEEKRLLEAERLTHVQSHNIMLEEVQAEAQREIAFINMEKVELERQFQSLQKCYDLVKNSETELEEQMSKRDTQRAQLEDRCRELEQRIYTYMEREQKLLDDHQKTVDMASELNKKLNRNLDEEKEKLEKLRNEHNSLIAETTEMNRKSSERIKQLHVEMEKEESKLQRKIAELEGQCEALSKSSKEVQLKLSESEKEQKKAKEINDKYLIHYNKKKDIISTLQQEVDLHKKTLEQIQSKNKKLEASVNPIRTQLEAETAKNKTLSNKLRTLEVQNEHADRQIRELKSQLEKGFFGDKNEFFKIVNSREDAVDASFMGPQYENGTIGTTLNDSLEKEDDETTVYNLRSQRRTNSLDDSRRSVDVRITPGQTAKRHSRRSVSSDTFSNVFTPGAANLEVASNMAYRLRSRESAASLNRSIISTDSARSTSSQVPKGTGSMFSCADEPMDFEWGRLSELQRRNTLCPAHLKTAYPIETQTYGLNKFSDDCLRESKMSNKTIKAVEESVRESARKRKREEHGDSAREAENSVKQVKQGIVYQKPGPPTPANSRRNSGKGSRSPYTPGGRRQSARTPRRTPRKTPRSTPGSTPGSSSKAHKRESVAFNVGFSPKPVSRLKRQTAFIQKEPPSKSNSNQVSKLVQIFEAKNETPDVKNAAILASAKVSHSLRKNIADTPQGNVDTSKKLPLSVGSARTLTREKSLHLDNMFGTVNPPSLCTPNYKPCIKLDLGEKITASTENISESKGHTLHRASSEQLKTDGVLSEQLKTLSKFKEISVQVPDLNDGKDNNSKTLPLMRDVIDCKNLHTPVETKSKVSIAARLFESSTNRIKSSLRKTPARLVRKLLKPTLAKREIKFGDKTLAWSFNSGNSSLNPSNNSTKPVCPYQSNLTPHLKMLAFASPKSSSPSTRTPPQKGRTSIKRRVTPHKMKVTPTRFIPYESFEHEVEAVINSPEPVPIKIISTPKEKIKRVIQKLTNTPKWSMKVAPLEF